MAAPLSDARSPLRSVRWSGWIVLMIVLGGCADGGEPEHVPWWMTDTVPALNSERLLVTDGAGTTVYRSTEPVCRSCDIGLVPLGRFGRMEDSILLRDIPIVERDAMGRFYAIAPAQSQHELILYDTDGSILRTIGRHGEGPGEFISVNAMRLTAGDTLLLHHDFRLSVFDSTGTVVRTVSRQPPARAPLMTRIVGMVDGYLALSEIRDTDTLRRPMHLYDVSGEYLGPYGPPHYLSESYAEHGSSFGGRLRPIEILEDGSFLVLGSGYRIERFDADGSVDRVVGVQASPDFPVPLLMSAEDRNAEIRRAEAETPAGSAEPRQGTERRDPGPIELTPPTDRPPPEPTVQDLSSLGDDLVAVAIRVASEGYASAPGVRGEVLPDGYHRRYDAGLMQQLRDTLIDVVDMQSGVILARTRVPSTAEFTSDGTIYASYVTEEGVVYFEAWELEFTYDPEELASIRRTFGAGTDP